MSPPGSGQSSREPSSSEINLKSKLTKSLMNMSPSILLIVSVTFVFIFSVGADLFTIWFIRLSFGNALKQTKAAETIIGVIQNISAGGTVLGYLVTLGFLTHRYGRYFLRRSGNIRESEVESLKTTVIKWINEAVSSVLVITNVTVVFICLIGAFTLALFVTSLVVTPFFVNPVRIFSALAVTATYVWTVASSLYHYVKDLVKMS